MKATSHSTHNAAFWLHLLITAFAWVAPFLVSWYIIVPIYAIVVIQFLIFGKCLVNKAHDLGDADDMTFYTEIFEDLGFKVNRRRLKFYVRKVFYPFLAAVALLWQVFLGIEPLWF
jgi:hypothetical protein